MVLCSPFGCAEGVPSDFSDKRNVGGGIADNEYQKRAHLELADRRAEEK